MSIRNGMLYARSSQSFRKRSLKLASRLPTKDPPPRLLTEFPLPSRPPPPTVISTSLATTIPIQPPRLTAPQNRVKPPLPPLPKPSRPPPPSPLLKIKKYAHINISKRRRPTFDIFTATDIRLKHLKKFILPFKELKTSLLSSLKPNSKTSTSTNTASKPPPKSKYHFPFQQQPTTTSTNTKGFIHGPRHIPKNNCGATGHHPTKTKRDDFMHHLYIITYSLYIFYCIIFLIVLSYCIYFTTILVHKEVFCSKIHKVSTSI